MNKNLPAEYKFNFFTKIHNFFSKIFSKKIKSDNSTLGFNDVTVTEVKEELKKNTNEISTGYFKNMNKDQFISQLENNPKLLYNLSIEQLEKLNVYYDDIIAEYEEKLKKIS